MAKTTNGVVTNGNGKEDSPHAPTLLNGVQIAQAAREQLALLTGHAIENVSGLKRIDEGWQVTIEAVEMRRIPDSNDVLASYEVQVDGQGNLLTYLRARRYRRDQLIEAI